MARPKSLPKITYGIYDVHGEFKQVTEEEADAIKKFNLRQVGKYILQDDESQRPEKPPKRRRSPKTVDTPIVTPKEQENQPSKATEALNEVVEEESEAKHPRKSRKSKDKPMFHCNACGADIDNPKPTKDGKTQCPKCLAIGKIVGKE